MFLRRVRNTPRRAVIAAAAIGMAAVCGCRQEMADQPRVDALEASPVFDDERGSRTPPAHTIATSPPHVDLADSDHASQTDPAPSAAADREQPISELPQAVVRGRDLTDLLRRGRSRFKIYCAPCHGLAGHGDGMVARRGFPFPPSYHTPRLRDKPLRYFFSVATRGKGQMPSYGKVISQHDRWAVAAYVRALQLSQYAPVHLLETFERQQLAEGSHE